jgi:hypothetical protein
MSGEDLLRKSDFEIDGGEGRGGEGHVSEGV